MVYHFSTDDLPSSYGYLFIVGLSGPRLSERDKKILSQLRPAGLLLLKHNIEQDKPYEEWVETLRILIEDAHRYAERDKLIVTLDHEGGRLHRCPPPITHFPPASIYAPYADAVGEAMAVELRSLGINLSWAPLADIHSNPSNLVIGDRAMGTTVDEVSRRAVELAEGLTRNGVLTCAKHFPGHGDTVADPHFELPVLDIDRELLYSRELAPFRVLADWGVPTMMTAHVLFKNIDSERPATLSPTLLRQVLRDQWHYDGVVIADDVGMAAVADDFQRSTTTGLALEAGCDMFIIGRPNPDDDFPLDVAKQVGASLKAHVLRESTLAASFNRIVDLCTHRLPASVPHLLSPRVFERHRALSERIRRPL